MAKITPKKDSKKKTWPRYFFVAAGALLAFALIVYVVYTGRIKDEFGYTKDYYGETFDELYALKTVDEDISAPILELAEEAFSTICTEEEAEKFGVLSRFCVKRETAAREEHTLELLCGSTKGNSGYLWVAYTQRAYDAQGALLYGSGSENQRILSRWGIQKIDGQWVVTEILEHP